jgi:hypothetical protein
MIAEVAEIIIISETNRATFFAVFASILICTKGGEMDDDKSDRGNPDRLRISLNEEWEVNYWTQKLGVSRERLNELVRKHGDSAENIREIIRAKER